MSKIKPVFLTLPSLHHDEEMSHRQHDGYRVVAKLGLKMNDEVTVLIRASQLSLDANLDD